MLTLHLEPSSFTRKLEVPTDAAMPCKRGTKKHFQFQETEAKSCESNKIPQTKHACIVEAHESTRQRLELSLPESHEDRIASKGKNSRTDYNLVHEVYSNVFSNEDSGCKSCSGQGMEKARDNPSVATGKNQSKNHKETKGHLINAELEPPKIKGRQSRTQW